MSRIDQLRREREDALQEFTVAAKAIEDCPNSVDPSELDRLKAQFERSEVAFTQADSALELHEQAAFARSIAAPAKSPRPTRSARPTPPAAYWSHRCIYRRSSSTTPARAAPR